MKGTKATLIYDGNCGFCRRWVARVQRWDLLRAVGGAVGARAAYLERGFS